MGLKEGRKEEPHRAQDTHEHKHPQEQAVDDHRYEFPVLDDLQTDGVWGGEVTGVKHKALPPSESHLLHLLARTPQAIRGLESYIGVAGSESKAGLHRASVVLFLMFFNRSPPTPTRVGGGHSGNTELGLDSCFSVSLDSL